MAKTKRRNRGARARILPDDVLLDMEDDPVLYVNTILPHIRLWSAMDMILCSVWRNKRTSVRAAHGMGKTFTSALAGVSFLNLFPRSIVITTAPTWRQVEKLLWKDISAIYASSTKLKGQCQTSQIKIAGDWYMYGFSSDHPEKAEGHHASHILWLLDEAKGLEPWLYNSIEGSLTGGFARVLEISTTDGAGQACPLRWHHTTKTNAWNCIHLSAFDSPLVAPDDPDLKKYQIHQNVDLFRYGRPTHGTEWPVEIGNMIQLASKDWIMDRRKDWEEKEPETWKTKVVGDFSSMGEDSILPLEWIEAATENPMVKPDPSRTVFGLDVAAMGADRSVLTERQGGFVFPQNVWQRVDGMQLVGLVIRHTKKRGIIHIDKIGVGWGPFSRLVEQGHPVIGVESGGTPHYDKEAFANVRAEIWWHARAVFLNNYEKRNVLSIPNDPELREELSAIRYRLRSDGRIQIERKEETIKRIGRSPDKADSLIYCLARLPAEQQEELPPELARLMFRHFPDIA